MLDDKTISIKKIVEIKIDRSSGIFLLVSMRISDFEY